MKTILREFEDSLNPDFVIDGREQPLEQAEDIFFEIEAKPKKKKIKKKKNNKKGNAYPINQEHLEEIQQRSPCGICPDKPSSPTHEFSHWHTLNVIRKSKDLCTINFKKFMEMKESVDVLNSEYS